MFSPVFGKLLLSEKEKNYIMGRSMRSKSEKRGDNQIAHVTITDKEPLGASRHDTSDSANPSRRSASFPIQVILLLNAVYSNFAKIPDAEQRYFLVK